MKEQKLNFDGYLDGSGISFWPTFKRVTNRMQHRQNTAYRQKNGANCSEAHSAIITGAVLLLLCKIVAVKIAR